MSSHAVPTIKGIVSSSRIMFGLLPGLGAMIVFRMAIHLYRPDIEDIQNRVSDYPFEQLYDYYDFIIVGAGSAGAVLANRLSENPDWNILLLEAGPDENVLSDVPVLFPILQTSSIDWKFVSEPSDQYCLSMVDGRCKWPRGKVLGGSSVLNAMLYIRGNKKDYDYWASLGNPGWTYDEVLPYFLKAEDMRIPDYQNNPYHATGGPISVEYFRYEQPITKNIIEAGEQLGYKVLDVNGEYQTGFTRSHATIRDGLRCSTAKGYLRPASSRENLHISIHSLVEKILLDENKKAYGVQFTKHHQRRRIRAKREVILSAGAIQSPQLLMLSGIGDAEDLKELGIYPVANLPGVGKNLQDHVAMGGHSFLFDNPNENGTDYCFNLNSVFSIGNLIDFAVHKEGSLYSMMEAEAMAFVNTKYQDPAEDYPDIQFFIAPTADNMDGGLFGKRANGLTDETYAELYEDILYESSFSVVPLLLRPKSRGYIKLRDTNPYSPPLIYPNYFSDPDDIKIMIEGARLAQALTEQPALKALNTRPNPHRNLGCTKHELMSDEHLECQARHHSLTIYHPVGTCAMGPEDDPAAVVDPRLRVYGIRNLRVVDGSIMPKIVNGNTNAPIIMIAEKASDMIKQDWAEAQKQDTTIPEPGYISQKYKTVKEDAPNKTMVKPDIFRETASLLSYLPLDNKPNPYNVSKTVDNHFATTQFAIPNKDTPVNMAIPNKDTPVNMAIPNKDTPENMPNLQRPYESPNIQPNPYEKPQSESPKYELKPYPYAFSDDNRNSVYISKYLPTTNRRYPYRFYYQNHNTKYRRPYKPVFNFYRPYDERDERPVLYTDEVVSSRGQKKCKIWLYYDGVKYEVSL